jgi:hypothetical protein
MDYAMSNLNAIKRSIGRGIVFFAPKWEPSEGPLTLTHLGDTEGDIAFTPNAEVATLTTPEVSGPAPQEADYTGEAPTLEMPLYLADPSLLPIVSPGGTAHAGRTLRRAATEYTLVVFPENLFIGTGPSGLERQTLSFVAGAWSLNGTPLTADQLALLANTLWCWRCVFTRPPRRFLGGAGDARKQIETVTAMLMHHPDLPDGHHLYTTGNPEDSDIDLDGMS